MVSNKVFIFGNLLLYCVILINLNEVSATLPSAIKAKEIREKLLLKQANEDNNENKPNPKLERKEMKENKLILKKTNEDNDETKPKPKLERKLLTIPKVGQQKKLAVETKPQPELKSTEPKIIKTSIGARKQEKNAINKQTTTTQKPTTANVKERLQNAIAERKLLPKQLSKPKERLVQESKVIEELDKKLSPIVSMLTKISKDVTQNVKKNSPQNSFASLFHPNPLAVRQFQPDSLERAETIHRGVKHLKNFMNIIEEVDHFLSSKAQSALKQLSYIYGGDSLLKPHKATLKDKLHKIKGRL